MPRRSRKERRSVRRRTRRRQRGGGLGDSKPLTADQLKQIQNAEAEAAAEAAVAGLRGPAVKKNALSKLKEAANKGIRFNNAPKGVEKRAAAEGGEEGAAAAEGGAAAAEGGKEGAAAAAAGAAAAGGAAEEELPELGSFED